MTKYGKYERDGLWSIKLVDGLWQMKWMREIMEDETNGMEFGLWTQQRWNGGKVMKQHKHNWGGVHKHKQDSGTRWLHITNRS